MKMNTRECSGGRRRAALVMAVVLGVAFLAGATEERTIRTVLEERIAAGDLEYRDPRTGEIVVATAERVDEIRKSLASQFAPVAGVQHHQRSDGTIQVSAERTFQDVFVSRMNLDGTRSRGCFRDIDAAVAFLVGLGGDSESDHDHTHHSAAVH